MDFLSSVGVEVVAGLVVAGVLAALAVLRTSPRRRAVERWLRPRICRHDWRPIETDLGGGLRLVTQYREQCARCGSKR